MTRTTLRPVFGIAFAALLALSLVATTADALTSTTDVRGGRVHFDQGFVDRGGGLIKPGPFLGVTWE